MIILTIDPTGAAFEDWNGGGEVSRILTGVAKRIEQWDGDVANWNDTVVPLKDVNGNTVGTLSVTTEGS